MSGETRDLAAFAATLKFDELPEAVKERTKVLILDIVGNMIRARHDAESTPSLIQSVARLGLATGDCSVFGDSTGYAAPAAALLNGALAHSLDFDDTHAEASLHSSAPIVPAALAAAEMTDANGRDVIAACVAGYEVQIRLAHALSPKDHYDQGFHPTATCGVFGAAAAAVKLLGGGVDETESAFGIALSQAAGSMQFLHDGAWTKRSHVGQAAQNGLMAGVMAVEGFKGPAESFEGTWGLLQSHSPAGDATKITKELGTQWHTLELALKPFPSCRYTHAPMDALIALRNEHELTPDDIESVDVGVSETGWKIIGDGADKQTPQSVVDGQFSMPFCGAMALKTGGLKWDDYKTHLTDTDTLTLTKKVTCSPDPLPEAAFPKAMAGIVRIKSKRGDFERYVDLPKGEPENFLSDDEARAKFDGLAAPYLTQAGATKLADALLSLEEANSLRSVMALGVGA